MSLRGLIADDERCLADYLAARLAVLWPELAVCGIADNGIDALAMIEREKPDVVFLDIKMPGLTGPEVARRMSHPALVVFVTAYQPYAADFFGELAVDYVLKPVDDEEFGRTIARVKERVSGPGKRAGTGLTW